MDCKKIDRLCMWIITCISLTNYANAQSIDTIESRWQQYINLDKYSAPLWKTDTIFDETVQPIEDNGVITANLLYKASSILSVKLANYSKNYIKGKDWDIENGRLKILPQSSISCIEKKNLLFTTYKPDLSMKGKIPGTYVLFTEKPYFSGLQIAVTYTKERSQKWVGFIPKFAKNTLPQTIKKLEAKKSLKVAFYGNSIEAGYNTSDHMNTPPYMPTWPELVIYNLRKQYDCQISFINKSQAGMMASWGLEQVDQNIAEEHADLIIIGFGMNDGASSVSPENYRSYINGIVTAINRKNPNAEFILIAPMLPNPDAIQNGLQSLYKPELHKLTRKGVVLADMTEVHTELLKHKSYQDMTGNNVNHPNDYLARWYAQVILGFLMAGKQHAENQLPIETRHIWHYRSRR